MLMWLHYIKFMKGKNFFLKTKKLKSKTKFWFGLGSLLYCLLTFGIFFWTVKVSWGSYLLFCIILIGISLSGYLFEKKN